MGVASRGMRPTLGSADKTISSQEPSNLFVPIYCEFVLPFVGCSVRKRLQSTSTFPQPRPSPNQGPTSPLLQHPRSASALENNSTTVTALSAAHNHARPTGRSLKLTARSADPRHPRSAQHGASHQHQHQHQHQPQQCPRSSPPRSPLARPWLSWPTS